MSFRAGNVFLFSVVLLAGGYLAADTFQLFPFLILKILFAAGCSAAPIVYIRLKRQRRMRQIEEMLPDAIDLFTRAMRAGHNIHSGLETIATETSDPLRMEFRKLVEELALGSQVEPALHVFLEVRFEVATADAEHHRTADADRGLGAGGRRTGARDRNKDRLKPRLPAK